MYTRPNKRTEQFILDVLSEVVEDKIIDGPMEDFIEALGYDGYFAAHGEDWRAMEALQVAVGTGNAEKVGKIVIDYIAEYYTGIAYAEIEADYAPAYVDGDEGNGAW